VTGITTHRGRVWTLTIDFRNSAEKLTFGGSLIVTLEYWRAICALQQVCAPACDVPVDAVSATP
jgi:hypothetical protein